MSEPPQTVEVQYAASTSATRPRVGLAITSLVLGIVSIPLAGCALLAPAAIITGLVAVSRANRSPATHGGMGLAIGGICTGGVGLLILVAIIALMLPALHAARDQAKLAKSMSNLAMISTALQVYAMDYTEYPPSLNHLVDQQYLPDGQVLISPFTNNQPPACDYSYVAGLPPHNIDPRWIIAFGDPAKSGNGMAGIAYMDGHVEQHAEPFFSQEIQRFENDFTEKTGRTLTIIPPTGAGP